MDEKLKSEYMQKRAVFWMLAGWRQVQRTALCWPHIYSDILENAPFSSQIFKNFFASGGNGGIDPLTKIPRNPLNGVRPKRRKVTRERVPIPRSIEHKAPTFREIKRSTASNESRRTVAQWMWTINQAPAVRDIRERAVPGFISIYPQSVLSYLAIRSNCY